MQKSLFICANYCWICMLCNRQILNLSTVRVKKFDHPYNCTASVHVEARTCHIIVLKCELWFTSPPSSFVHSHTHTTTTHKTALITSVCVLAPIYQSTVYNVLYWIHNCIIRYNCMRCGLAWQPNEAAPKIAGGSTCKNIIKDYKIKRV